MFSIFPSPEVAMWLCSALRCAAAPGSKALRLAGVPQGLDHQLVPLGAASARSQYLHARIEVGDALIGVLHEAFPPAEDERAVLAHLAQVLITIEGVPSNLEPLSAIWKRTNTAEPKRNLGFLICDFDLGFLIWRFMIGNL